MLEHPATQENLKVLAGRGGRVVEPAVGALACGEEGRGRLPEPEEMAEEVVAQAVEDGKAHLRENMAAQGIADYRVFVERDDLRIDQSYNHSADLYIETKINVIAVGLPVWIGNRDEDKDHDNDIL